MSLRPELLFRPARKSEVDRILLRRASRALFSVAPEVIATTCLIGIIWWGIGATLSNQRVNVLDAAVRDTSNLARAFEENTQRVISGADQVLLALRAAVLREGERFDLDNWVKTESSPDWLMAQMAVIGPDGVSVASTASTRRVSVADRTHFVVQKGSNKDELYISAPVLGRSSGRWTIQLTRKIITPDGHFGGIVVLSVDCYQLSGFYESLNLARGFIELVGLDGIVRARGPFENGIIGSALPADLMPVLQDKHGMFHTPGGKDALTVAYRQLAAYPLVVLIAYNDKAVLAAHRRSKVVMLWSGGVATLVLLIIGAVWIKQRKRTIRFQNSLALTLDSMSQGLVMVDDGRHVRVVNRRALDLLGLPHLWSVLEGSWKRSRPDAERQLVDRLHSLRTPRGRDLDHTQPVLELSVSPTPSGGTVQTVTDVTARHLADHRIRHMALHDQLTGLGNRVLFADHADQLIALAQQEASRLDILSLDLNGFKKVNDTFGHEIGDALLVEVAERLKQVVSADDIVARTGGDEFAILCRPIDPLADVEAFALLILQALTVPFILKGQQIESGVSIGIARFPADGADRSELLRNADLALDVAKSNREHPIRRFDTAIADNARLKLQLEEDLRDAIGTDQIFIEFQPQFRTSSLAVVGFEALVRWMHPVRGRLSPDKFIPLAEEAGLIVPLGRQVLEIACRVALHWPENVHIAVNLSPIQFRDPGIITTVQEVLAQTGLPASRLELEVTEGVLIADEQQALRTLSELRELGVTLALDDFGTGYASLSYLRKFPFEQIKLDRSFVQAQVLEERSRHILRAVLSLSRSLQLSVVAEGVETRTQLHLLRKQGCHAVQGFLVGRPMSRENAETMFPSGATECVGPSAAALANLQPTPSDMRELTTGAK